MKSIVALGLMCGTSVDAIDVAWLRTDGQNALETGPTCELPVPEAARALIKRAMEAAKMMDNRDERGGLLGEAEELVDALHIEAIEKFAALYPAEFAQVELIGYHGQTVFHAPQRDLTVQLGQGKLLAKRFNIPVVYDFRGADVAAGGQGAPLVPVFHQALAAHHNLPQPCVFVNIGGVANVTWVNTSLPTCGGAVAQSVTEGGILNKNKQNPSPYPLPQGEGSHLLAFDCGPGNALIDDAMMRLYGQPYDACGARASAGQVYAAQLAHWLAHPFFDEAPPKSLDRNMFAVLCHPERSEGSPAIRAQSAGDPSAMPQDDNTFITTLSELTVQGIVRAAQYFPHAPKLWLVAGGGAKNAYIMKRLADSLDTQVQPASKYNIDENFLEAQAFAYLAVRSLHGLPLTFPRTTGVAQPMRGGGLVAK